MQTKSQIKRSLIYHNRIILLSDDVIVIENGCFPVPWDDRIRRRFKLRDLDILMAVISAGSMGKAATRLNMAQPAVSKAVADLEHMLGVRMLDRSRQGVEPTPYGLAFVKRGVAIFDELRQGVQDMDFLADPTAGEIGLAATEPVAAAIIAPLVDRLSRQYLRMTFHVVTGDTGMLYRELAARNVELVVSRVTGPLAEEHSVETLFNDPLVVVTGANNPLTRRRKIDLAELLNEPWVLLPLDSYFGSLVADAFRAAGLAPPRLTIATTSHNMRNELLATGRYLTVVPGFSVRLPRKHPVFRVLPVALPKTRMPIVIITLKNRSLSPLAQLFIQRVRAFTKPLANS
jgi:DNA-binding transcriptional LysR family regulator